MQSYGFYSIFSIATQVNASTIFTLYVRDKEGEGVVTEVTEVSAFFAPLLFYSNRFVKIFHYIYIYNIHYIYKYNNSVLKYFK